MEIWATPTHPPLRTYTNSSLASCILMQLSDLCNFRVCCTCTIRYHNTCWRHVCRGASHLPNSLIYKKVPQIAVCEQRKSEKLGILCFWTKKWLKIQGRVIFCQICTLWGKKKKNRIFAKCPHSENQEEIHFWKICTLLRQKILGMGLVESSQMHRLRNQGGLRELSPLNILSGGLEYPVAPQKILYPKKFID